MNPKISIIIPCRNEEAFIGRCLNSIVGGVYPPGEVEVLVIDGMSGDKTRTIVKEYAERYPFIRLLDNLEIITPKALNIGIRAARGNIILRMDAHAEYERNYINKCAEAIMSSGADNVGGAMLSMPQKDSLIGRSIVAAISSGFGVGNSTFRVGADRPVEVDTVFGGCYRRSIFERVGLFNENLQRGQDIEFNLRLKRGGGRILLVPDIVSTYYARSSLLEFIQHNWTNGVWAIIPFRHSDIIPVRLRHMVPMLFVLVLLLSMFGALFWSPLVVVFAVVLGMYLVAALAASLKIAVQMRSVAYVVTMPVVFAALHFPYGLGSLWGGISVLFSGDFWKRQVLSRIGL